VQRNGLQVDNGQHVFLRCCTAYRELLERIGAVDGVTLQSRLEIPVLAPGGKTVTLRRTNLPAPTHLASSLLRYSHLSVPERAAAGWAMSALQRVDPDDPGADARSFGDWLRSHRQSPAAIERLWGLIARPTLNLIADDASLAQAAYVFQTGLLSDRAAGDVGWARVPLSEIHDFPARRALASAGVEVQLRRRAVAVSLGHDGEFDIEFSGGPTVHADVVIVAVPHDRVARLVPDAAKLRPDLSRLGTSPIVNLHVVYDRRVLEHPFVAGVGTPVQWVFDRTESAGLGAGQYLAVSLSAAETESQMTVDELREQYLAALAELLPAARGANVEQFFVSREQAATFRAAPRTALSGLVLAGAWTDTGWPATMEGAVRSGAAASREALAVLGNSVAAQPARAARVAVAR
jgi:squalene-associated FAD-dependent desaturase